MMNIILISTPVMDFVDGRLKSIAMDDARECPPYGIYLLDSILRRAGFESKVIDLIQEGSNNISPYEKEIAKSRLVGISATSLSWPTAVSVIQQIRKISPKVQIVLGGIHPTLFDKYVLETQPVNYVVRGEGEQALVALCQTIDLGLDLISVPNLSWISDGNIFHRNPIGKKITKSELSEIALPDFVGLRPEIYNGMSIESSRGCIYDCSFCSTSYRKSYRAIDPIMFANRVGQLLPLSVSTKYKMIHIVDDEFSINPRRSMIIADELRKRNIDIRLTYDSRAKDVVFPGFLDSMIDYTFQFLVGAECGYDRGLKIIGKQETCKMLENAASQLYKKGINNRADFSFIIGLPWETMKEIKQTIKFAFHLLMTYGIRILLQWYVQMPGSRLWQSARDRQIVNETMYDDFGFFRNVYLHQSEMKISPSETWEITELIAQLSYIYSLTENSHDHMVEYGHPDPISIYFPKYSLKDENVGLANLREAALPKMVN